MINGITPASTSRIDASRTAAAPKRADAPARAGTARPGLMRPSLAADMVSAMGPPLDLKKIEEIRAAIADGRYAIDATAIADRMVDADMPAKS